MNEETGEYTYTAYLIPFQKQFHKNRDNTPYDISNDKRDICLRLDSPGYYLIPSQSNLFRISRSTIDGLLSDLE